MVEKRRIRHSRVVKERVVSRIIELANGTSNVSEGTFNKVSKEFAPMGVKKRSIKYYWRTTMETGKPTRLSVDNSDGVNRGKKTNNSAITKAAQAIPYRDVSIKEACGLLLTTLLSQETNCYNCVNFDIGINQYNEMLYTLEVTGMVGDVQILDLKKYHKVDIHAVFRFSRRPKGKASKRLSPMTRSHYKHIIKVLIEHLGENAGLNLEQVMAIKALSIDERSKKFSLVL